MGGINHGSGGGRPAAGPPSADTTLDRVLAATDVRVDDEPISAVVRRRIAWMRRNERHSSIAISQPIIRFDRSRPEAEYHRAVEFMSGARRHRRADRSHSLGRQGRRSARL